MKTLMQINKELAEFDHRLWKARVRLETERNKYELAEALWKNELDKNIMQIKLFNPSWRNPDINAQASIKTYNEKLEVIKAESRYRRARNKFEQLLGQKETAIEESYNTRQEMKKHLG